MTRGTASKQAGTLDCRVRLSCYNHLYHPYIGRRKRPPSVSERDDFPMSTTATVPVTISL